MKQNKLKKKKIAIIGTVGVPANYGGFETLAEHLIEDLGQHHELTVYCSGKKYPKEQRQAQYKAANLKYLPLDFTRIILCRCFIDTRRSRSLVIALCEIVHQ